MPSCCRFCALITLGCLLQLTLGSLQVRRSGYGNVPTAVTCNGTHQGRYLAEFNQDLFLGVPFANAPRLHDPTPWNTTWSGKRDASQYGPICYGFGSNPLLNLTQSEDCLNLNVIRPSGTEARHKLPVLLWIYGGGFRQGGNADPMWNLSYIVSTSVQNRQAIIAVSLNYRLSFLGFPGGKQALEAGITNLGLKDQRVALHWIQENIAAFGGDPSKVTIWGESAGGISVSEQIIAYGGRGGRSLFRGAIMGSGAAGGFLAPAFATDQQAGYDKIVTRTGCNGTVSTLACLRAAPISAIYPSEDLSATGLGWGPVIDGEFLRRSPTYEIESGNFARVPILLGSNSDEGLFAAALINQTIDSEATLAGILKLAVMPNAYNSTIQTLLSLYPDGSPAPPYSVPIGYPWCDAMAQIRLQCGPQWRRFAAILGDPLVLAPRRYFAQQWGRFGLFAYSYRFDTAPTTFPLVYINGLGPGFAIHGADLAYSFGLPPGFTTPIDFYPPVLNVSSHVKVSYAMVSKWISFVHSGDPNGFKLDYVPDWPSYGQSASNMVFNATADGGLYIHVEEDTYRKAQTDFINSRPFEFTAGAP